MTHHEDPEQHAFRVWTARYLTNALRHGCTPGADSSLGLIKALMHVARLSVQEMLTALPALTPKQQAYLRDSDDPIVDPLSAQLRMLYTDIKPPLASAMLIPLARIAATIADEAPPDCPRLTTFEQLCDTLHIDDDTRAFLRFITINEGYDALEDLTPTEHLVTSLNMRKLVAAMIGFNQEQLAQVLAGPAVSLGLISLGENLDALDAKVFLRLLHRTMWPGLAIKAIEQPIAKPDLPWESLTLPPAVATALTGLASQKDGFQLLLNGPPGTGKTTLARALLQHLGLAGVEIVAVDKKEKPAQRAALLLALQRSTSAHAPVVLVDEADDLLLDDEQRAWIHRLLEQPNARAIWIVNHSELIHASILRRFHLHYRPQSPSWRSAIDAWRRALERAGVADLVKPADIATWSRAYPESVGRIEAVAKTAARVARQDPAQLRATISLALAEHALSAGAKPPAPDVVGALGANLAALTASTDLSALRARLRRFCRLTRDQTLSRPFSLLLHGPPGTGKSALARKLAAEVARPVLVRRLSDLLGPFVGMTERAVAQAFAEATLKGAVLVLDEVDALAPNRANVDAEWRANLVNEMLSQLDDYRGIIIATTNLGSRLDPAFVRRFTDNVHLDYASPDVSEKLWAHHLAKRAATRLTPAERDRLRALTHLTPADFGDIAANAQLEPRKQPVSALLDQLDARARPRRPARGIGFTTERG